MNDIIDDNAWREVEQRLDTRWQSVNFDLSYCEYAYDTSGKGISLSVSVKPFRNRNECPECGTILEPIEGFIAEIKAMLFGYKHFYHNYKLGSTEKAKEYCNETAIQLLKMMTPMYSFSEKHTSYALLPICKERK